jgi:hypothetical protein
MNEWQMANGKWGLGLGRTQCNEYALRMDGKQQASGQL